MLELYQAEWCPTSHRVRERLTELGLDYLVHQVPVDRDRRTILAEVARADTIPALVLEDGTAVVGGDAIEAYLDERFDEPSEAEAHRVKAATMRRRYLSEECECSPPARRPRRARGRSLQ